MRAPADRDATAGFTLLEALIAMVLLGTILAAVATLISQWLPNWNRGVVLVQANDQLALGLERMLADVASAEFIPRGPDVRGVLFDGSGRSVRFVRAALGPNRGQDLELIRLEEIDSERGPILVRTRATYTPRSTEMNAVVWTDPVVLLRPPYRITISYAGPDRVWRDEWLRQMQLPHAVRLSVRDSTRTRKPTISTATLIRAEVPVDCLAARSRAACEASYLGPPDRPRS